MRPIDLRSDTVTKPDEVMRAAMASAEVGDDVLDHDPTMRLLEERVAELLNVEAALWVPSGCMGNAIALIAHLQRGDAFLAPEGAHVLGAELGTSAWLAGGMPVPLPHDAGPGRYTPQAVRASIGSGPSWPYYSLRTTLLCTENTHNSAGGTVTTPAEHLELVAAAREGGLAVHVDGARIWNAAVALRVAPAELVAEVDTVQVCLSKGLGAPVGSLVGGSAAFVTEARRLRKMLGGGIRQGGVLAAAGLVALERREELLADHDAAAMLAAGLVELGWEVAAPQTNIVLATVPDPAVAVAQLAECGVLAGPMAGRLRFVTHRDVRKADIAEVLSRLSRHHHLASGRGRAGEPDAPDTRA